MRRIRKLPTVPVSPQRLQLIVDNFIGSMDLSMPLQSHIDNIAYDAMLYQWDSEAVDTLKQAAIDAYKKK